MTSAVATSPDPPLAAPPRILHLARYCEIVHLNHAPPPPLCITTTHAPWWRVSRDRPSVLR
eukprot:scaffold4294_cov95-Skeletonema_dohrnii-CCMP3373.AAC.1